MCVFRRATGLYDALVYDAGRLLYKRHSPPSLALCRHIMTTADLAHISASLTIGDRPPIFALQQLFVTTASLVSYLEIAPHDKIKAHDRQCWSLESVVHVHDERMVRYRQNSPARMRQVSRVEVMDVYPRTGQARASNLQCVPLCLCVSPRRACV